MILRTLALVSFALLLSACSSPQPAKEPAPSPEAAPVPASPYQQALALYDRAWEAYLTGDVAEARRLTQAALYTCDAETDENTHWRRVQWLRHVAMFQNDNLGQRDMSPLTFERHRKAFQRLERIRPGWSASAPLIAVTAANTAEQPAPGAFEVPEPVVAPPAATTAGSAAGEPADPSEHGAASNEPAPPPGSEPSLAGRALSLEKRILQVRVLLSLGWIAEARTSIDEVLADVDAWGFSQSPVASRARELRASAHDPRRERDAQLSDVEGGPSGGGDGLGSSVVPAGASGSLPDTFGIGDPRSLQPLVGALSADPSASSGAGGTLPDLGDLASAAGDFDLARRILEEELERGGADPDRFDASMGLARLADAEGVVPPPVSLYERVAAEARRRHPPDHPLVLEARERHARAVRRTQGAAAFSELLESHLADQERTLGAGHPATDSTRQQLADVCVELGDPLRALELKLLAQRERRAAGERRADGELRDLETSIELSDQLRLLGDDEGAFAVLRSAAPPPPVVTGDAGVEELRARALELESDCRLAEALELRRQIVDLQRGTLAVGDPARTEGLNELAALLRVLGRAGEARQVETEARVVGRTTAEERERLLAWRAEASARLAQPPRVGLAQPSADAAGVYRVVADVEDASGILSVHLVQDGIPRSLSLDAGEWTLDETGTRGRLELLVPVPEGQRLTVISIAARNLRHATSEYQSVVLRE